MSEADDPRPNPADQHMTDELSFEKLVHLWGLNARDEARRREEEELLLSFLPAGTDISSLGTAEPEAIATIANPDVRAAFEKASTGRDFTKGVFGMKMKDLCVTREFDASFINQIVNHPDVKPWVAPADWGYLDLSALVSNPENVLLVSDGGGFLFVSLDSGAYEVHSQFLPTNRGREVLRAAVDAAHWMFTRTDCVEIFTKVPDGNLGASALARASKGEFLFHVSGSWPSPKGLVGTKHYWKNYQSWVRDTDYLASVGHQFHEALEQAKAASGSEMPVHADDESHDRYVGAACEMIAAGQPLKGVAVYNRWAKLAGYAPITLIQESPTIVDIQDAVIAAKDGEMEVLLCR